MLTIQLAGGRTFRLDDTLLDQPVERVLRYQQALSPETTEAEAGEARYQRRFHGPAAGDALAQLTAEARLTAFAASPEARALVVLVEHVEQQPVTDYSDQALRDRLSYLLACGLTPEQVAEQHERVAAELRLLAADYRVAHPDTAQQLVETARAEQRRVLALCDHVLGMAAPALGTRQEVANALLDLLEPAHVLAQTSSIHPQVRQRALDSLCLLLLQAQRASRLTLLPTPWQKKPDVHRLPLGLFLEHLSHRFPA